MDYKIPEEGIMLYEIKDTDGLEEGEYFTFWTVWDPWVTKGRETETIIQAVWLSKEYMEEENFLDFELESDCNPRDRGIDAPLISATWTDNAEDELRWFLSNEQQENHGGVMLQQAVTRMMHKNSKTDCDYCSESKSLPDFKQYRFDGAIWLT